MNENNRREEIVKYHLSMGEEISEIELNGNVIWSKP